MAKAKKTNRVSRAPIARDESAAAPRMKAERPVIVQDGAPPATLPPTIFGAWFDNHRDSCPRGFEMPWDGFVDEVTGSFEEREDKFDGDSIDSVAPGFSLARFVEIDGVSYDDGTTIKRRNRHVDVLSGIVLDFDEGYDEAALFSAIEDLTWLAYTTFKHKPNAPRWRVVFPFAQPIPARFYKAVRAWLVNRLGSGGGADEQAKAVSNFYFLPACPADRTQFAEWRRSDGVVLEAPPVTSFRRGFPQPRLLGDKLDWTWLKAKMSAHKDATMRKAFRAVLKGRSFAEHGSRDNTLVRMCGALAGWAPHCDPDALAGVFAPSLAVMEAEEPGDPPPSLDNAADKIARAQSSLLAQGREDNEAACDDAQEADLDEPVDDFAEQAAGVGLSEAGLSRRLLLRHVNSVWCWSTAARTWVGPMPDVGALWYAHQELSLVPGVEIWCRKTDGGLRKKTLLELAHDHGEVVMTVRYDLSADAASIETSKRALTLVGAPRRALEPAYDEFVDSWFRALGGATEEKLLDWIASLSKHERPNSVLFLRGSKGVGKGLFVRGLARVWEVEDATDMSFVAGQFNDELLRCPLVIVDEGKWSKHVDATLVLRKLVTQAARMINAKNLKPAELKGHLRFVVTGNNFNLFSNDEHSLTPDDRDAIAQRFFEVHPSIEAEKLLLSIPYDDRNALAEEDRIARHALWLAENREVKSDGRFFVEGDPAGGFATRIVTEDHRWGSWTVEWLARWLNDPTLVEKDERALVSRGPQGVVVSPEAVVNTFEKVLKNKQAPRSLDISNALRSLSSGELVPLPGGRGTGFEISIDEVVRWSKEKGIGDPARIRANAATAREQRIGDVVPLEGRRRGR